MQYYPNSSAAQSGGQMNDWSGEISRTPMQSPEAGAVTPDRQAMMGTGRPMEGLRLSGASVMEDSSRMDLRNHLPSEVINSPISTEEAYRGSLKAMLAKYVGTYVVASFLVGTQNTVSWEGILYDVGNDYVTIYQAGRDRYIVSDIYSLKFIEFYDTRRRELCNNIIRDNWQRTMP